MAGINNRLGIPQDYVWKGGKFEKSCLLTRDAFCLELSYSQKDWHAEAKTSDAGLTEEQVFHHRNAQIIYIPQLDLIDLDTYLTILFRSRKDDLIQSGIEKRCYQTAAGYFNQLLQRKPHLRGENKRFKSVLTHLFCIELKRRWHKHKQSHLSAVPFVFSFCRSSLLYGSLPSEDLNQLWKVMLDEGILKTDEELPLYAYLQQAIIKDAVPFKDLIQEMEMIAFGCLQSSIVDWEGLPAYRFQEILIPFRPSEAMQYLDQSLSIQLLLSNKKAVHLMRLIHLMANTSEPFTYPSKWLPAQKEERLENFLTILDVLDSPGVLKIADSWIAHDDPYLALMGFFIHLAIPRSSLGSSGLLLMKHMHHLFGLSACDHSVLCLLLQNFIEALKADSSPLSLDCRDIVEHFLKALKEKPSKTPKQVHAQWVFALAASCDLHVLLHAYQSLTARLGKQDYQEKKIERITGLKLFKKLLDKQPKHTLSLLKLIQKHYVLDEKEALICFSLASSILQRNDLSAFYSDYLFDLAAMALAIKPNEAALDLSKQAILAKQVSSAFKLVIHRLYQAPAYSSEVNFQSQLPTYAAEGDRLLLLASQRRYLQVSERSLLWLERLESLLDSMDGGPSLSALYLRQAHQEGFLRREKENPYKERLEKYLERLIDTLQRDSFKDVLMTEDFYRQLTTVETQKLENENVDQLFLALVERQVQDFKQPAQLFCLLKKMIDQQSLSARQVSAILSKINGSLQKHLSKLSQGEREQLDHLFLSPHLDALFESFSGIRMHLTLEYLHLFIRDANVPFPPSFYLLLEFTLKAIGKQDDQPVFWHAQTIVLEILNYYRQQPAELPSFVACYAKDSQIEFLTKGLKSKPASFLVQALALFDHHQLLKEENGPLFHAIYPLLLKEGKARHLQEASQLLSIELARSPERVYQNPDYAKLMLEIVQRHLHFQNFEEASFWLLCVLKHPHALSSSSSI